MVEECSRRTLQSKLIGIAPTTNPRTTTTGGSRGGRGGRGKRRGEGKKSDFIRACTVVLSERGNKKNNKTVFNPMGNPEIF